VIESDPLAVGVWKHSKDKDMVPHGQGVTIAGSNLGRSVT
jgi:hypothetical protein